MPSRVEMDELDQKIIKALQRDARTNFTDIARDCNVSTDTVSKRFRRMKRAGIIVGSTPLVDPKSFGYEYAASLGIRVEYPHIEEVVDYLKRSPEIQFCTPSLGRYNIFALAVLRSLDNLAKLNQAIKQHAAVREVKVSLFVDQSWSLTLENVELDDNGKK
jgi:DNA-binding Lrp family transcriptional regulator